jgi:N-acetylneuraminic acid mutarotase
MVGRVYHTATLSNNIIYIIGGDTKTLMNDVLAYNIASNSFTTITCIGTLPARRAHTATLYNDFIYVIGGTSINSFNGATYNDVYQYTISTKTWTSISYSGSFLGRSAHTATLYNNIIYIIGGYSYTTDGNLNDIVAYDIITSTFTTITTIGSFTPRQGHSSFLYNNAIYIVCGGFGVSKAALQQLNDIVIYDIASSSLVSEMTLSIAREKHTAIATDDAIYIIGGTNGYTNLDDVEVVEASGINITIITIIIIIIIIITTRNCPT